MDTDDSLGRLYYEQKRMEEDPEYVNWLISLDNERTDDELFYYNIGEAHYGTSTTHRST